MAISLKERISGINLKSLLTSGLVLSSLIMVLNTIHAYYAAKDFVVGVIVACSLFGLVLNLVTIIGNLRNSYYTVYLYFVFTIVQIFVYTMIAISFPVLVLVIIYLTILDIVAFLHARILRIDSSFQIPTYIPKANQSPNIYN